MDSTSDERNAAAKKQENLRELRLNRIKDLRRRGYSATEAARIIGIPLSTLRSIEESE